MLVVAACGPQEFRSPASSQSRNVAYRVKLGVYARFHLPTPETQLTTSTIHDEPHGPFSGMKDSGMGREGGQWSMDDLTQLKWITIQQGEAHYPF